MKNISLESLGFNKSISLYRKENQLESFLVGRVILEHRERYMVLTEQGELEAELLGNLRYMAQSRADFPAVGDWVALSEYDSGKGLIHAIYPRFSMLERQAVGKAGEKQIIAANIDYGLIVQSVNRDFSINRLERYLTICNTSQIKPIILLNKVDLLDKKAVELLLREVNARIKNVPILPMSNLTGEGLEAVSKLVELGKTYCLLGSSGVGKSSLINSLSGSTLMDTGEISDRIDRGKHVTTHRELIMLASGGIIIDNPGMREVGIADSLAGLEMTFDQIHELAKHCKFNDCTHTNEKGCAVLQALETGELDEQVYKNYMKLEREQAHYASSVHERRAKDKRFGKMVKKTVMQKKINKRL